MLSFRFSSNDIIKRGKKAREDMVAKFHPVTLAKHVYEELIRIQNKILREGKHQPSS